MPPNRQPATRAVSRIDLASTADRILIPVHAQPGARNSGITGVHDGRLKVAVTEAPEKGKANAALIKLIAAALGLKRSQIELASGDTSRQKTFRVRDVDLTELRRRLAACIATATGR